MSKTNRLGFAAILLVMLAVLMTMAELETTYFATFWVIAAIGALLLVKRGPQDYYED